MIGKYLKVFHSLSEYMKNKKHVKWHEKLALITQKQMVIKTLIEHEKKTKVQ